MLPTPATGVVRRAEAGCGIAFDHAREYGLKLPASYDGGKTTNSSPIGGMT